MTNSSLIEKFLYITLALIFILAIILTVLTTQSINTLKRQTEQLHSQQQNIEDLVNGIGTINEENRKALMCVLTFFGVPNRVDFFLSDLKNCTVTNVDNGETRNLPIPAAPPPGNQHSLSTPSVQSTEGVSNSAPETSSTSPSVPPGPAESPAAPTKLEEPVRPPEAPVQQQGVIDRLLQPANPLTCDALMLLCL